MPGNPALEGLDWSKERREKYGKYLEKYEKYLYEHSALVKNAVKELERENIKLATLIFLIVLVSGEVIYFTAKRIFLPIKYRYITMTMPEQLGDKISQKDVLVRINRFNGNLEYLEKLQDETNNQPRWKKIPNK